MEYNELPLVEVVNIKTGKLNSNAAIEDGAYPFFTCAPEPLRIDRFKYDQAAILLAGNNAEGNFHINYYEGKFEAYQRTYIIDSKDAEKYDLKYVFYALKECLHDFKLMSQGTSTKFLTMAILNSFKLKIPSIEVQRKISGVLSTIDEKIENNTSINRNLSEQADALFKAYFVDCTIGNYGDYVETDYGKIPVGWKLMELGDAGLDISDGNYSSKYPKTDEFLSEGIPFIRGTDFNGTSINQSNMMYISPEKHAELKKGHTKQGDILITTRGDIGRIAFVPDSLIDVNINSQLVRINGSNVVPRSYLACYLTSSKVQRDFKSLITGSALQQLPIGKLKKVMFLLPDKEILEEFAQNVEPIFQAVFAYAEESIKLGKIRDSLLPKLMSGELDVSNLDI